MTKTYYFQLENTGTEIAPHYTFRKIEGAINLKVAYMPQLDLVKVTLEATSEQDTELSKTDLTGSVFNERVSAFKAKADAVRATKVSSK